MPQTRSQEKSVTLEKAMICFWERGFDGSTIGDLEAATGIDRKQIFRDFDNKKGIFLASLAKFEEHAGRRLLEPMEHADASLDDIRGTLMRIAAQPDHSVGRFGCLLCNTSTETSVMTNNEVDGLIKDFFSRIEQAYSNAIKGALNRQQISLSESNTSAAARTLLANHIGMLVLVKSGRDRTYMEDIAGRAVDGLRQ